MPEWVKDSIFYQIFVDRFFDGNKNNNYNVNSRWGELPTRENFFGGDLEGISAKITYLKDLGITAIYLTPIFKAPSNHKYDTEDYLKIDPSFGNIDTLKKLLEIAHDNDIRIILDGVFNHTGDYFWAFRDIIKNGKNSPYLDWYFVENIPVVRKPKPNYKIFGEAEFLPKINLENPEVKKYIFEVVKFWTNTGIDGWRLDVPFEIKNHDFWKEFRYIVKKIKKDAYLVGEFWEDASPWLEGDEFDGATNYRLLDLIKSYFVHAKAGKEDFIKNTETIISDYGWIITQNMLNLLGSHDTKRFLTVCDNDIEKFKLALAFIMTFPGAPIVYYGDEVGITGDDDPDNRRAMLWDYEKQNKDLISFYKDIISIRKKYNALRRGSFRFLETSKDILAFQREYDNEFMLVLFNRTPKTNIDVKIEIENKKSHTKFKDVLTKKKYDVKNKILVLPEIKKSSFMVLVEL
jgi:cyclomaltodextrinase / maltogenic alpha-amylase / neopullulanase